MVWHLMFLSSHLSKLLPQNVYFNSFAAILNNSLPTKCCFFTKHPQNRLCHGVTFKVAPFNSFIFEESIHIIIICNLSYGWCIDKELNQVQGFMIVISFYIIKAAFRKLVFHVTPWHSTFFEMVFLSRTLFFLQ